MDMYLHRRILRYFWAASYSSRVNFRFGAPTAPPNTLVIVMLSEITVTLELIRRPHSTYFENGPRSGAEMKKVVRKMPSAVVCHTPPLPVKPICIATYGRRHPPACRGAIPRRAEAPSPGVPRRHPPACRGA